MNRIPLPPALAADMEQVEALVAQRAQSRANVITAAGTRLLEPDAERIRAALVLVAALAGDYRAERVLHAAAAVELIYAATQTHGNMVDETERRRGASRSGAYPAGIALMVGDYLFALAAGEMALLPDPRVISYYAQAVMCITESALATPAPLVPLEAARTAHIERLGGAAALVAAACKAGATCTGAPPEQVEALAQFGHELGLALVVADEVRVFGNAANDAPRLGIVTLPLIFAANADGGERFAAAVEGDPSEQRWALATIRQHGIAPAQAEVARRGAAARTALDLLPHGPARAALDEIVGFVLERAG